MQDLAELERRISAALARIEAGLTGVSAPSAEVDALRAELAAERAARAALEARLQGAGPAAEVEELQARIAQLTRQLDAQGIEAARLRQTVGSLRESLRSLRSGQAEGVADAAAINRALQAEVEAMRVERLSEMAELDGIIAELDPLLGPAAEESREDA